ncbi:molybdopterin-guanine dinucleotide biosynthesis protein B [Dethiosulfatibacter aminovorans DSM 17477]|uniref:Molybdopterin-guanine dinucleotide biosynthesis protein B n=1 Tax=Dethiosulfatibacter aminovorans DSM 17477 TaxID=1121476 RepID=A0A1M6HHU6_9FIRM|nr:molybdopterin-guanine dinucleotide biosynthesis protein MobB [Dethiosulfatibacter aminovorans]SHJ21790.1 molybdopterin-guanine dinucleotide biosynthesis protein B [Dethiosulfatibacter aminovorans DSM 17477]
MKVFSIYGYTQSGKTTIAETMIAELAKRRYSVGSIKEIHFEEFNIDTPGSNTDRHRNAGASPVTARGHDETDVMYPVKLSLPDILKHYSNEYVVCEGVTDYNLPKIIAASSVEDLEKRWEQGIFAVSGRVAEILGDEYRGVPVINVLEEPARLADLVVEKVFDLLPDVNEKCCNQCGYGCRGLTDKILAGEATRNDCIQKTSSVKLFINGKEIGMVPFVEEILRNACTGVVSTLEGYSENSSIEIKID